jgi:glycosyltransferase involved in cell wall biosynthesis
MRVVHLIDSLRAGGKERQVIEVLKGLVRSNVQVMLGVMDSVDFFKRDAEDLGIAMRHLPRWVRWDPFVFQRMWQLLNSYKPDLIHTHDWMTSFYAVPLAKTLGVPLVNGSIRNSFRRGDLRWHLERMLLCSSDGIVANSHAGLRSRRFDISPTRTVIHNGFDPSRLTKLTPARDIRRALDIEAPHVVGMVAVFKDHKDYPTYLAAAQQILSRRDDVVFLAVGDGDNLEACKRTVPPSCTRIRFVGGSKDVESLVNVFDIGVLATHGEGISNSIMEYMALGKPVVASEGGGTCELVQDGATGFLVARSDPEALAARICQLLDSRELRRRMGAAGQSRIEQAFSVNRLTADILNFYESVLVTAGRSVETRHSTGQTAMIDYEERCDGRFVD